MKKLISNSKKSGIKDLPRCAIVKTLQIPEIAFMLFVAHYDGYKLLE